MTKSTENLAAIMLMTLVKKEEWVWHLWLAQDSKSNEAFPNLATLILYSMMQLLCRSRSTGFQSI
jgi:hypothetical protein